VSLEPKEMIILPYYDTNAKDKHLVSACKAVESNAA
jgi:hypothetical protein